MNDELEKLYKEFPHLRGKSKAEIERQNAASEKVAYLLEREERKAQAQDIADRINNAITSIVDGLRLLDQHGFLSDEVRQAHTSTAGVFTPHLRYKPVDAERVLNKQDAKDVIGSPKKTRRKRA